MTDFDYDHLQTPEEANQLVRLLSQCFNTSPTEEQNFLKQIGFEHFRVIRRKGQLLGGLGLISMGQWWGEQRVPMVGVAGVGIAPEQRGSGAALALMQHMLEELYETGVPISVLYPAAQRLYHKVGYEQGGLNCRWEVDTGDVGLRERWLPITPITPLQPDALFTLHQQQAQGNNGNLDRAPLIWEHITQPNSQESIYGYLLGSPAHPEGYVVFSQKHGFGEAQLQINDWVVLTPVAATGLWSFLSDHRSQIGKVQWKGSAVDLLSLVLPEQEFRPLGVQRWMLRLVDVKQALEKRGYPSHLTAELHLEVNDDGLPANTGRIILTVEQGKGSVVSGGSGCFKIGIRGLSPLYTGLFTAHQLQMMGFLEATYEERAIATQLFAGPPPWMPDFF